MTKSDKIIRSAVHGAILGAALPVFFFVLWAIAQLLVFNEFYSVWDMSPRIYAMALHVAPMIALLNAARVVLIVSD